MGVYGRGGDDPGVCGGVFFVGFVRLCGACGCVWVGLVGACGGGTDSVFLGIRTYPSTSPGAGLPPDEDMIARKTDGVL